MLFKYRTITWFGELQIYGIFIPKVGVYAKALHILEISIVQIVVLFGSQMYVIAKQAAVENIIIDLV